MQILISLFFFKRYLYPMLYRRKKIVDLKLAVHIATHSALRSIDHMGELLKAFGKFTHAPH